MPFRFMGVAVAASLMLSSATWAAPTAEQRAEILALGTLMTKAANLFNESKYQEAGEVVKEAQTRLAKLAEGADQQTLTQLSPLHKKIAVAHEKLKAEKVALPELKPLPEPKPIAAKAAAAKPVAPIPAAKGALPKGAKGGAGVSFVNDVAPILNARCGGCHVRNARGQFSMATFENLMKGPMKSGKVIFPGDVKNRDRKSVV